jgi:hypothetical protein
MNCSDYDDGSEKKFSWGNQSYRESKGYAPYDPDKKSDPFLRSLDNRRDKR